MIVGPQLDVHVYILCIYIYIYYVYIYIYIYIKYIIYIYIMCIYSIPCLDNPAYDLRFVDPIMHQINPSSPQKVVKYWELPSMN